jgi:hypothetical protein
LTRKSDGDSICAVGCSGDCRVLGPVGAGHLDSHNQLNQLVIIIIGVETFLLGGLVSLDLLQDLLDTGIGRKFVLDRAVRKPM